MKERLVGAAVLVTLGVVLIPLLLDGPEPQTPTRIDLALPAAENGARRHTIEIKRGAETPAGPGRPVTREPPPTRSSGPVVAEAAPSGGEPAKSQPAPAQPSPKAQPAPRAAEPPPPAPAPRPAPAAEEKPRAAAASPAPARAAPGEGAWAVQVGSFGSRDNADKLRRQLSGKGFPVFLMEIESGGRTLHRVRVGPYAERAGADEAARRLAAAGTGGTVVRHEG